MLWVNAAGNYAQQHWSGTFTDANADGFEDFVARRRGPERLRPGRLRVLRGAALGRVERHTAGRLRPLHLPGGRQHPGRVVGRRPASGAPPTEEACYTPRLGGNYFVAISRYSGSGSPRIDLWTIGGGAAQYEVAAGSVTDPAASPNALAVGAVCWNGGSLEPYSSQGPTIDGRNKPDIAGDDRMSSFTYGAFDSCSGTGGFAGTSAASPAVAGLAALVKQFYPSDTAAQLRAYLTSHALDEGPVGTGLRSTAPDARCCRRR